MASSKDLFEVKHFASRMFASGMFRGTGLREPAQAVLLGTATHGRTGIVGAARHQRRGIVGAATEARTGLVGAARHTRDNTDDS